MNKLGVLFLAVVCMVPTTLKAQRGKDIDAAKLKTEAETLTAKEWVTETKIQGDHATAVLMYLLRTVKSEVREHYAAKGNKQRAQVVQDLNPNIDELMGRIEYAKVAKPDALLQDVVRGYIIAASAPNVKK